MSPQEQDPYIRQQFSAEIPPAEGVEAAQESSHIERLGDYASSRMDSMKSRIAATVGAGALVLGGGAAAQAAALGPEHPFMTGSDTERTDAIYCAYIGYEHRLGEMEAAPSSQDPYKLGKVIVNFNEAWVDCGDFIDVETRARFRVLIGDRTKWEVSDWGASTWGREADGKKVVNGLDYAGATCDKDYGSDGSRDSMDVRPQLEHTIRTLSTREGDDYGEPIEKVVYETAPMRDAKTIECRD